MEKQEIRTFGRRHGKKLSARQQWLVENLLPELFPDTATDTDTILEIGFGAGEHLLELAIQNPDAIIIGAEPYINGVASLLSKITRFRELESKRVRDIIKPEYKNIRIWPDDIRKLFSILYSLFSVQNPNLVFDQIWVLHPDPWPKSRHEKRRLLSAEFLNELAAHLAPGGEIIIGTDHLDYYDWIVEQIKKTNLRISNLESPISTIATRYQRKDMFGAAITKYLVLSSVVK